MRLQNHKNKPVAVRIKDIYIYTVLFFTFYTSGFIYNFVFYGLNKYMKAIAIAVVFLGIPMLKPSGFKKMIVFILIESFFVAWTLIAGGSLRVCITTALRFTSLALFFILCGEDRSRILSSVQKFIIVIAVVYLVAWLLFDIGPLVNLGQRLAVSIQHDDGTKRSWVYTSYFNLYYRWHDSRALFGLVINSSNGPFWEPGMYQIWLNFALYYELFEKKADKRIVALLVVAVIATTSTMGILEMAVILLGHFYSKRKKPAKIALLVPVLVVMVVLLDYLIADKVSQVKGEFSLDLRMSETVMLWEGFLQRPILGHGLGTAGAMNSLLLFIYDFGALALISIAVWCVGVYKNCKNWVQWLVMLAWAAMSMVNEPVLTMNLFFLVLMCLFKREKPLPQNYISIQLIDSQIQKNVNKEGKNESRYRY